MAKTIKKLKNGLRIKFLKREARYFLFVANRQIMINNEYQKGYMTLETCEASGKLLQQSGQFLHLWADPTYVYYRPKHIIN